MFEVVIGEEIAFVLAVKHKDSDFLEVIESSPEVVLYNLGDISVGDTYSNGIFFDADGNERALEVQDEGFSRFAFVKDGVVLFTQTIPSTLDMVVAAYSSNPEFRKA